MTLEDHSAIRLVELETMIETNHRVFYDIGKALKEIRDSRLYLRIGFNNFKGYVKKRWDMDGSYAYRLIDASSVIDNLSGIGKVLPLKEAQARPLVKLDESDQRKMWREFQKSGMGLSAKNIREFISARRGGRKGRAASERVEIISKDYKAAVDALMYQIRISQNDRWKSTSREAALYWNRVMKDKIARKT